MALRSLVRRKELLLGGLSSAPVHSVVPSEVVDVTTDGAETPHTVGVREGEAGSGEVVDEVEDTGLRYSIVALLEPPVRLSCTT